MLEGERGAQSIVGVRRTMRPLEDGIVAAEDYGDQVQMMLQWLELLTPAEQTIIVMQLEKSVGPVLLQLLLSVSGDDTHGLVQMTGLSA